ncbi:hypothetical protein HKD37_13G036648 [Glycine soja]
MHLIFRLPTLAPHSIDCVAPGGTVVHLCCTWLHQIWLWICGCLNNVMKSDDGGDCMPRSRGGDGEHKRGCPREVEMSGCEHSQGHGYGVEWSHNLGLKWFCGEWWWSAHD